MKALYLTRPVTVRGPQGSLDELVLAFGLHHYFHRGILDHLRSTVTGVNNVNDCDGQRSLRPIHGCGSGGFLPFCCAGLVCRVIIALVCASKNECLNGYK